MSQFSHEQRARSGPSEPVCCCDNDLIRALDFAVDEPSGLAIEARWRAANDPATCFHILNMLLALGDKFLLRRVAEHPALAPADMYGLCSHPDPEVRTALAVNPGADAVVQRRLSRDENPDVRYALAETYAAEGEVLSALLEDENPYVAGRARQTLRRLNVQLCAARSLPLDEGGQTCRGTA